MATKHIYYGQLHSWGELFYSTCNELLDDDDFAPSEEFELENESAAIKVYVIVKINFKE